MFDELQRELHRLQGQGISVTIPSDKDGYLDRECPSSECQFNFKIHEDDWLEKVSDEEVFCPFCRHPANSDSWLTRHQHKYIEEIALSHVDDRINFALKCDADQWNRRLPRNSFISITMQVNSQPRLVRLPFPVAAPMKLKIDCPKCDCRYAVIGAAFFCPACGHNAADLMFSQSITGIRKSLDALDTIRIAIPDTDTAEITSRLLIENGLQQSVTVFQRYAEALYAKFPITKQPRRNAFQNLTEGSELWFLITGKRYDDYLSTSEFNTLERYFQQRHLLAHTQGIVDTDYINHTGDTSYQIGQHIVIRESVVFHCLSLIEKLAISMASEKIQD